MKENIDIHHLANLVKLNISQEEQQTMLDKINDVLKMVQQVCDQDVEGVTPLAHPTDMEQHLHTGEEHSLSDESLQKLRDIAPEQQEGFFIVPRVVE